MQNKRVTVYCFILQSTNCYVMNEKQREHYFGTSSIHMVVRLTTANNKISRITIDQKIWFVLANEMQVYNFIFY